MKQLSTKEYQKRAILVQKLAALIELNQREPVAKILCYLTSPIGQTVHPFKMSDNEFLGLVETEINKLENYYDEDEG